MHAKLLHRLTAAGAKAVVFDIIFDEAGADAAADREFTEALRANGHAVLAAEISRSSRATPQVEGTRSLQLSMPAKPFLDAAAAWGLANADRGRRFCCAPPVHPASSHCRNPVSPLPPRNSSGLAATNPPGPQWLRYYGRPLALPHVSYSAALRADEVSDEFFRGKIVFIGARPMAGSFLERKDEFRSPLTTWGDRELFMPAVEVHATQLLNLLRGDSLRRLSPAREVLVLVFSAILCGWVLFCFRPLPAAGIGRGR